MSNEDQKVEKLSIKYAGQHNPVLSTYQYQITLPLHPTDYEGLLTKVKKDGCYQFYQVYSKWMLRGLDDCADGTSVTCEQVEQVMQIAERIMRGQSEDWDPESIEPAPKEVFQHVIDVLSDVYAAVDGRDTEITPCEQLDRKSQNLIAKAISMENKDEARLVLKEAFALRDQMMEMKGVPLKEGINKEEEDEKFIEVILAATLGGG